MAAIRKVWIEEGCISCALCQDICSDVFKVPAGEESTVRADASQHFEAREEDIRTAAADCPVEIIQISEQDPAEG